MADYQYPLAKLDFFYEGTQERFIAQVVRAFSGFQYESFPKGVRQLNIVPCRSDIQDALVASYIKGASDVTAPAVPLIAVTYTGLALELDRLQNPFHLDYRQVSERKIVDGAYTNEQGRTYTVERLMPRPFEMTFDVDVWTSNKKQKFQLLEQMLTIFMPCIQIQNSENALDWGAQTTLELVEMVYSSEAGPVGTNGDRVDYFTLKMRIPMWLSPPAKVTQRRRIEQININLYDGAAEDDLIQGSKLTQIIVSPDNACIGVQDNEIILLGSHGGIKREDGSIYDWAELVKLYGNLRPGTSTIRLSTTSDPEDVATDIVGTIEYDMSQYNRMIFTVDPATMPANTLSSVAQIINPRKQSPGVGLPYASIGQRYLIQSSISPNSVSWGTLAAQRSDIIEFDGTHWNVSFRPVLGEGAGAIFVTNSATQRQLKWDGQQWDFTYNGLYRPGFWRLHV